MYQWTKIRDKLENEYLADALKGRVRYFATAYRESHDGDKGRAAIYLDGQPVISGSTFEQWLKPDLEEYYRTFPDSIAADPADLENGWFDQYDFYLSFREFDNQSIEMSRSSPNQLIRIFAILDRRVGKRTLCRLKESIDTEPEIFRRFFTIRMEADELNV